MGRWFTYLAIFVLILGLAQCGWGTTKIIIVTNNPGDEVDYTPFLKSILGYDITVEAEDDKYIDPLNAEAKADLRAADLIIVSRRTSSGNFDAEIEFWNGLETPLLLHSAFLIGDNRWQWMPGGNENVDLTHMSVVDPKDPLLDGVTVTDGQVEIFSTLVTGLDVSDQTSVGNGTKVATPADSDLVMIARWAAGTEYYPGSGQITGGPRIFFGMRTDEFFPFVTDDGKKMLENAILMLLGIPFGAPIASDPRPVDMETDVSRDVILAWTPADITYTHDVYFGNVFDDVNGASRDNPLSVLRSQSQIANTYDPADPLEFDRTYYWRIDEIGSPADSNISKGNVWSFTVESLALQAERVIAEASSFSKGRGPDNTVNGSGLDANDLHSTEDDTMWLSGLDASKPTWIQYEFDKVYRLQEMWIWNHNGTYEKLIGIGAKDVTIEYSVDGTNYEILGTTHEFAQAPGEAGYAHNTTVDFADSVAKYVRLTISTNWGGIFTQYGLSEVRFFYIPTHARRPYPTSGATDVNVDVTLAWRAGREASRHQVYLSTDQQAVMDGTAPVTTTTEASTSPLSLDLDTTYYWRVEEINDLAIPAKWEGDTWSFTTQEYLVVDDFESYNDVPEGEAGSNLIYGTWLDGFESASNGSTIGYTEPFQPSMETGVVHSGNQSAPFVYDNSTTGQSEVTVNPADLPIGGNWTKGSTQILVLWFSGDPGNAITEQMYVKVNGIKVVYPGDAADIAEATWKPFIIDLAGIGIDLSNITQLSIGFERAGPSGGSGIVFIDDIRLYRTVPEIKVLYEHIWSETDLAAVTGCMHIERLRCGALKSNEM